MTAGAKQARPPCRSRKARLFSLLNPSKLALMPKRTCIFRLILAALLAGAGLGAQADFADGFAAYERGDYATALREWQPLAEQGDAVAQFNLGLMYDKGEGVPQDDKAAVQWYRRAAEQGHADAQNNLGVMHANGEGVPQDDQAAVQWFRRAAEQGLPAAQAKLGGMYAIGRGVPQDDVYAHMWANIAASGGDKNAIELRNLIAEAVTPFQITEAQKLARECIRKAYKDC